MPVLQRGVAAFANEMPKIISPKGHAIIDYATAGTFAVLAGLFWGRHKRAALAAIISGGTQLTAALLTERPIGIAHAINLRTHVKIDFALAAAITSLPSLMGFDDDSRANWFRILGLNVTANAALTDTKSKRRQPRRRAA
jgi:hypothetical protein